MGLVIDKNPGWKQEISIGARNTQNVVHVPYARFIHMLSYKAELVSIDAVLSLQTYALYAASSTMSSLSARRLLGSL
jgi:putative transposase